jgi:hypothetical protein
MQQYDLKELDCDGMVIHPNSPKIVTYLESKIPLLKKFPAEYDKKGFKKSMVYRYVLLMYDPKSPIQEMMSLDWWAKKFESIAYAGFELKNGRDGHPRFDEQVLEMALGKIQEINDIVILFIAWINNYRWNHRVFLHESILQYTKGALAGDKESVKGISEVRALRSEINVLDKEMIRANEETEEFVSRFYYHIEQSRLAIRPEDYAKRLADGDDLSSDSPYGINYRVNKITFAGDKIPDGEV